MRSSLSRLFLVVAVAVVAEAQDLPGCGSTCVNSLTEKAATLGCPGGALSCLCANNDFLFGIRDCAKATCAADLFPTVESYVTKLCASATAPVAPAATTATTPPAPATPTTPTTPPPAPTTSSSLTSPTVPPAAPTTLSTVTSSPPAAASSSSQTSSTDGTKSTSASTSGATVASDAGSTGMSNGAKIGVGIGAAAGGVALIAIIAFILITRRHKNKSGSNPGRFQISEPLPGSGRSYANDHHHKHYQASGKTELESNSRRYEDMTDRQKPRTVI